MTRIDGVDSNTALQVISEIGLDMSRWPTRKTWPVGVCPTTANRRATKVEEPNPPPIRTSSHRAGEAQGLHHSKNRAGVPCDG